MKKIVCKIDLDNPPQLTGYQEEEVKILESMADNEIDFSDIPPLDEEFWKNAIRNPLYKPKKTTATVRIDADIMAWLKSKGKGYQTRMNKILRKAMLEEMAP